LEGLEDCFSGKRALVSTNGILVCEEEEEVGKVIPNKNRATKIECGLAMQLLLLLFFVEYILSCTEEEKLYGCFLWSMIRRSKVKKRTLV